MKKEVKNLLFPGGKGEESTPMDLYFTGVKLPKSYGEALRTHNNPSCEMFIFYQCSQQRDVFVSVFSCLKDTTGSRAT